MTRFETIQHRHSVRAYQAKPLSDDIITALNARIAEINIGTGLHIQLVTGESKAFQSPMAKYGKFSNVTSYLVMAGKPSESLEEEIGYYGEELVLLAQEMGANSCWVGLTYRLVPEAVDLSAGDKVVCVIALGYGVNQGVQHKSRFPEDVSNLNEGFPEWFRLGVEAALLAPTAVNQQKFYFELMGDDKSVRASSKFTMIGYSKVDLGIAKYHFELGVEEYGRRSGMNIQFRWTEK